LGATALMHAALYASERCMKVLVDKGADVNAATSGGSTALMWAAGEPSKIRFLLARGADRHAKNNMGMTALDVALLRDGGDAAAKLLAAPGQVLRRSDAYRAEKLEMPLFEGDGSALEELRAHGWNLAMMRQFGVAPLWFAALRGNGDLVSQLLDAGADPNKRVQYVTLALPPVGLAAYSGNLRSVQALIDKGADVNAKGSGGYTPLMLAAAAADGPSKVVIELLLTRGGPIQTSPTRKATLRSTGLCSGAKATLQHCCGKGGLSRAVPRQRPRRGQRLRTRAQRQCRPSRCCNPSARSSFPKPDAFPATTSRSKRWRTRR
jgi:ankyrin repeat protein